MFFTGMVKANWRGRDRFGRYTKDSSLPNAQLPPEIVADVRKLMLERLQESDWHNSIRRMIRNLLDERGVHNVSYEDINRTVVPRARAMVPADLQREVKKRVRDYKDQSSSESK